MKSILYVLTALALAAAAATAAEPTSSPLWLRYPAISPDGGTIVFSHQGDIWSVPAAGGDARPLTVGEAYDFAPVWSRDGSRIAFASDRFGGFDVFIMSAAGGPAERLTFHSAGEIPSGFTADAKAVLFSAVRQDPASNAQYPTGLMSELYRVPAEGGRVTRVLPVAAEEAVADAAGRLLYHDVKGYESPWRKHHVSAVTRDVWLHDPRDGSYRQISTFAGEDRNPVFGAGGDEYFWLSERDGTFNVWRGSLAGPQGDEQLTTFARHPVRFLTRSDDGLLCFGWHGGLYTLRPGGEPQAVPVRVAVDGRADLPQVVPVREKFTEMALAPGGKEFAYVFRGEIFVSAVEGGVTKRITDTPWQERSVSWSPDGRSLAYAVEVDGSWDVHVTSIVRDEEPYFHVSTVLETKPAVSTSAEEFQPAFSPDGKEIAYLEDRVTLKVVTLESGKTRTVLPGRWNYSYADGDQYFAWSPDGRWLAVEFGYPDRVFYREVGLVAADGKGEVRNLTLNGYEDLRPRWALDGKAIVWGSDREGAKREGGGSVTGDVYAMFLTREAWDRFQLTKEELALVKEQEEKAEKKDDKKGDDKDKEKDDEAKPVEPIVIDEDGLTDRFARLTTHTSPVEDWLLSQDGETLYYVTSFEKGDDLWSTELRGGETKLFVKVGGDISDLQMSSDGKAIAFLADGKPRKVEIDKGEAKPLATRGEMVLRADEERAYIFEHSWRQLQRKFYLDGLHGVDWDFYRAAYEPFLAAINNNHDFAEMLSEMLGELNASHTGCYYRPDREGGDETASLGLFYDDGFAGPGLRVDEVIAGGPLDRAAVKLRAGHVIEKIDGRPVDGTFDWVSLLNRKAGEVTLLSVRDPDGGDRWDETVKPISGGAEYQLLYERWVRMRRAEVEKLSGGRLGYVHVRSMNDASMRTVFAEALGRHLEAEGLIVDTRFNGGGNIHEQLSDFLSGKPYFDIIPRGQYVGSEPYDKWKKPSIVIMGESNYSDAHLFPVAYKLKGVGKTLGMPVPGTGTFVWWERQIDQSLRFGIPMGGWRAPDGTFCENTQLEPDIRVRNEPGVMSAGRDQQLEAAVKELLGR